MEHLIRLIDGAYTAALEPAAWPAVVRAIQRSFDCASAGLYNVGLGDRRVAVVHLCDIDPAYVRDYVEHYLCDNPWIGAERLQQPGVVRTDRSLDEYHNQPGYYRGTRFFNEWLRPQDFVYSLGTNLFADETLRSKLYLYRSGRTKPFSAVDVAKLKKLSQHLINAVRVAKQLEEAHAQGQQWLELIERMNVGVLVLDGRGRLAEANAFARALLRAGDCLRVVHGEVVPARTADAAKLAAAVRSALALHAHETLDASCLIRLRRASGRAPLRAMAVPLQRRFTSAFGTAHAAAAVIVTDPERQLSLPEDALRERYDLTNAEARLARHLLHGVALRQAAASAGVSYQTARSYLKGIFQKTGASRQSDLVRLLLADQIAPFLPR